MGPEFLPDSQVAHMLKEQVMMLEPQEIDVIQEGLSPSGRID